MADPIVEGAEREGLTIMLLEMQAECIARGISAERANKAARHTRGLLEAERAKTAELLAVLVAVEASAVLGGHWRTDEVVSAEAMAAVRAAIAGATERRAILADAPQKESPTHV